MSNYTELIQRADALIGTVDNMSTQVDKLERKDKSRRRQLVVLAVSIILDLVLSMGLLYSFHNVNSAQVKSHEAIVAVCVARNDVAVNQHKLWDGLLALPRTPDAPPIPEKTLDAFHTLLDNTFAINDCTTIP